MILFNLLCAITLWNLFSSIFYLKNKQKKAIFYCGIIGYSGKTPFDKEKVNLLMIWNSLERGKDSTGIYSPKNGLIKEAENATKFLTTKTFEEDNMLIAHVRAKTVGVNSAKNAHPFLEDNICLVHNGTLKNHYPLLRKYDLNYQYHDVDSHIMCSIISKEKNFKVLSEINGAAAVLIHDTNNPDVMYAFRNSERPLFKGSYDGNMYISSIAESLSVIGCKNIKEFKENYLYTIVNGLIQGSPRKIASKPYSPVITTNTNMHNITPKQLFGYMLKYDTQHFNSNYKRNLTFGNEYRVIGYTQHMVIVVDDEGKELEIGPYAFAREESYFTKGDYVKSRVTLSPTSKKDSIAIEVGSVCMVTKDFENGKVKVLDLKTNQYWDVENHFLKKLTQLEVADILDPTENLSLNFMDSFDITKNPNNNPTEEEDLELDEEDDSDYYDMQVNEDKLVNDFENIAIAVKDFNDFVKDIIPEDKEVEYKTKKGELDDTINECLSFYNITNNTNK